MLRWLQRKITDEQLEKLQETIEAIANSEDNDYGEADKEFRLITALSASNPIVQGMIVSLLITHNKINSLIQAREREPTVEFHMALYTALEARDL